MLPKQEIRLNGNMKNPYNLEKNIGFQNWMRNTGLLLILAGVLLRLLPHPANFAPIAALALFGGTYLNKKYALLIPLVAVFLSDLYLGFYSIPIMAAVYGSFIIVGLLGLWLKKHKNTQNTIGVTVLSSVLFFVITNFAVWAFSPWYAKTLPGLLQCYYMALPFFRNTLLGDFFYVGVFFGVYAISTSWASEKFKTGQLNTIQ